MRVVLILMLLLLLLLLSQEDGGQLLQERPCPAGGKAGQHVRKPLQQCGLQAIRVDSEGVRSE